MYSCGAQVRHEFESENFKKEAASSNVVAFVVD